MRRALWAVVVALVAVAVSVSANQVLNGGKWNLTWLAVAIMVAAVGAVVDRVFRARDERAAAVVRLRQVLAAKGISEEEIIKDFKQWRAGGRK